MGKIVKDIRVAWWCPEVRWFVIRLYLSKVLHLITIIMMFPLLMVVLLFEGLRRILDQAGTVLLLPVQTVGDWACRYQHDQINHAHSRMSIEEIQQRLSGKDNS